MRTLARSVLAGGISVLLASGAVSAAERAPQPRSNPSEARLLRVVMPDGSVRQIRYRGTPPARLVFVRDARSAAALRDRARISPFAMMAWMTAQMDRQFELMRLQAMHSAATAARSRPARLAGAQSRSPNMVRYSMSSVSNAGGSCVRSVRVTSLGDGQPPEVVRQSSGDCGAVANSAPAPARAPAKAPAAKPKKKIDLRNTI